MDQHLASCSACRALAESWAQGWSALGRLGDPGPAPDDWGRIEAALDDRHRLRAAWPAWALAPRLAASAWMLAGLALAGGAGGALVARAALAPGRVDIDESRAFAEILGDLPSESPAAGLAVGFGATLRQEEKP